MDFSIAKCGSSSLNNQLVKEATPKTTQETLHESFHQVPLPPNAIISLPPSLPGLMKPSAVSITPHQLQPSILFTDKPVVILQHEDTSLLARVLGHREQTHLTSRAALLQENLNRYTLGSGNLKAILGAQQYSVTHPSVVEQQLSLAYQPRCALPVIEELKEDTTSIASTEQPSPVLKRRIEAESNEDTSDDPNDVLTIPESPPAPPSSIDTNSNCPLPPEQVDVHSEDKISSTSIPPAPIAITSHCPLQLDFRFEDKTYSCPLQPWTQSIDLSLLNRSTPYFCEEREKELLLHESDSELDMSEPQPELEEKTPLITQTVSSNQCEELVQELPESQKEHDLHETQNVQEIPVCHGEPEVIAEPQDQLKVSEDSISSREESAKTEATEVEHVHQPESELHSQLAVDVPLSLDVQPINPSQQSGSKSRSEEHNTEVHPNVQTSIENEPPETNTAEEPPKKRQRLSSDDNELDLHVTNSVPSNLQSLSPAIPSYKQTAVDVPVSQDVQPITPAQQSESMDSTVFSDVQPSIGNEPLEASTAEEPPKKRQRLSSNDAEPELSVANTDLASCGCSPSHCTTSKENNDTLVPSNLQSLSPAVPSYKQAAMDVPVSQDVQPITTAQQSESSSQEGHDSTVLSDVQPSIENEPLEATTAEEPPKKRPRLSNDSAEPELPVTDSSLSVRGCSPPYCTVTCKGNSDTRVPSNRQSLNPAIPSNEDTASMEEHITQYPKDLHPREHPTIDVYPHEPVDIADDGIDTADQALPTESAREHALVPRLVHCRDGAGLPDSNNDRDDPTGDSSTHNRPTEHNTTVLMDLSQDYCVEEKRESVENMANTMKTTTLEHALTQHQGKQLGSKYKDCSEDYQIVPGDSLDTPFTADLLYTESETKKTQLKSDSFSEHSLEKEMDGPSLLAAAIEKHQTTHHGSNKIPRGETEERGLPSPSFGGKNIWTGYCQERGGGMSHPRSSEVLPPARLNLAKPYLRLGLSKKQRCKPLHSRK